MKIIFSVILLLTISLMQAQELPYYEISESTENYTAGSVAGRMIDGLGFRYYWSTEGLTAKDLAFQSAEEARTTQETIEHVYSLSNTLLKYTKTKFEQSKSREEMSFTEMRAQTLYNLEAVSNRVKASKDISEFDTEKDGEITVPFYYLINGPIADAIWHTGQLASYRRSSGNPINSKINHFSGTVRK
ncbi:MULTISPECIES: hypothetical protein [Tenacibaculum]|uniref:hypothetical protein n=1 Tax=Tenacibaculum TaxID=104267 RepID=UPI001F0B3B29|nr:MULTISPECIES: hypothetical protein [Tenacibaculum]MCH3882537.1 hypothetical protein [Tenacibaculum aquimarinum]MDO6599977.1 hypothetical protein [Tenacibaculum sp. 1_MG-2023]